MTELSQDALVALSKWIDTGLAGHADEARHMHRVIKVAEESGEAIAALIGCLGANPRKGVTHTVDAVIDELLDVAVTALGAVEHLTDHQGTALTRLDRKIVAVAQRVGLVTTTGTGRDDRIPYYGPTTDLIMAGHDMSAAPHYPGPGPWCDACPPPLPAGA